MRAAVNKGNLDATHTLLSLVFNSVWLINSMMDSGSERIDCDDAIPDKILEAAKFVTLNLFPTVSKKNTHKCV